MLSTVKHGEYPLSFVEDMGNVKTMEGNRAFANRLQQQRIQADILQEREAQLSFLQVRSFVCVHLCYILE